MKTLLCVCGALILSVGAAPAADRLIIHEWGTFTSLEDENGLAIAGINSDDEPAPPFCHGIGYYPASQGAPAVHPDVTMRLETPVLYVHAPAGFTGPLDVKVTFRGGWLTEYYPDADATAAGLFGHITPTTMGALHWANLKIGGVANGPATDDNVWTSPRKVAADAIRTPKGESEKFLFYRGVGNVKPILQIVRDRKTGTLALLGWWNEAANPRPNFWLVDIRADGSAAFQQVDGASRPFVETDYSRNNIAVLRSKLESELIAAGLYKDEAEALLNTWQLSYFKSPGLRAFYVCPQEVADRLLPLTITPAADIKRVMMARIELVTPEQRQAMVRIGDPSTPSDEAAGLFASLGRFRDALLLDQERRHPNADLEKYMLSHLVTYYKPSEHPL